MLFDGVQETTVAKVLGHSLTTLRSTYAHALPAGDDAVRSSMARRSKPSPVGKPLAHVATGEVE